MFSPTPNSLLPPSQDLTLLFKLFQAEEKISSSTKFSVWKYKGKQYFSFTNAPPKRKRNNEAEKSPVVKRTQNKETPTESEPASSNIIEACSPTSSPPMTRSKKRKRMENVQSAEMNKNTTPEIIRSSENEPSTLNPLSPVITPPRDEIYPPSPPAPVHSSPNNRQPGKMTAGSSQHNISVTNRFSVLFVEDNHDDGSECAEMQDDDSKSAENDEYGSDCVVDSPEYSDTSLLKDEKCKFDDVDVEILTSKICQYHNCNTPVSKPWHCLCKKCFLKHW